MFRLFTFTLFFCSIVISPLLFAQSIDDETRAEELHQLAKKEQMAGNTDEAYKYFNEALSLNENNLDLLISIGNFYSHVDQNEYAIDFYQLARSKYFSQNINDEQLLAKIWYKLANIYNKTESFARSLNFYKNTLAYYLAKENDDNRTIANLYESIAKIFIEQKNYRQTIFFLEKSLERHQKNNAKYSLHIPEIYSELGAQFSYIGNFEVATEYHEKAINYIKNNPQYKHIKLSQYIARYGNTAKFNGEIDKALKLYKEAVEIGEEVLVTLRKMGRDNEFYQKARASMLFAKAGITTIENGNFGREIDVEHQTALQNIRNEPENHDHYYEAGRTAIKLKHFEMAVKYYSLGRDLAKKNIPNNAANNALFEIGLGNAYHELQEYDLALDAYGTAYENVSEKIGKNSELMIYILEGMSNTNRLMGNTENAIQDIMTALDIVEVIDEDHERMPFLFFSLGEAVVNAKMWQIALDAFDKSIQLFIRDYGIDHTYVTHGWHNIGKIHFALVDYDKSINFLKYAEENYLKSSKNTGSAFIVNDNPLIIDVYRFLSKAYIEIGNYEEALLALEKAIEITTRIENSDSLLIAEFQREMGNILLLTNDTENAYNYTLSALGRVRETFSPDNFYVAPYWHSLAKVYLAQKEYKEAKKYLDIAMESYLTEYENSAFQLNDLWIDIAENAELLGDAERAIKILEALMENLSHVDEAHPDLADLNFKYATILDKKEQNQEALYFYQKALNIYIGTVGPSHPKARQIQDIIRNFDDEISSKNPTK